MIEREKEREILYTGNLFPPVQIKSYCTDFVGAEREREREREIEIEIINSVKV